MPPITLEARTLTGPFGLASPLNELTAQAARAEAATVAVPQFRYSARLDAESWRSLDLFEQRVMRSHDRSEDPDPVFFGQNSSLWFKSLLQRDVGELGADAIVTSGVMLWGRFQKTEEAQSRVQGWLESIASRANIEFNLQRPDPELWWGPVWARAVKDTEATPQMLAAILQHVKKDQEKRPSDQGDLAEIWLERFILDYHDKQRAYDVHQEVERLLQGPFLRVDGRPRSRDSETSVYLGREALLRHWDLVNEKLAEVYPDALTEERLADCIVRVAHLRDSLNLNFPSHRILPQGGSAANSEQMFGAIKEGMIRTASDFVKSQLRQQAIQPFNPPLNQVMVGVPLPNNRPMSQEDKIFHWALCGFALRIWNSPLAAECFQNVDALFPVAPLTEEAKKKIWDLREGKDSLVFQNCDSKIVEMARKGFWDEALDELEALTDPRVKSETLASLAQESKTQSFSIAVRQGQPLPIGRSPGNDLILSESQVSNQHAQIEVRPGANGFLEVFIRDVGSTNGTVFSPSGIRLVPYHDYVIPRGESALFGLHEWLYNGLPADARTSDEILIKKGLTQGEWVIQTKAKPVPAGSQPSWFDRLPKRDRDSVPEAIRGDIPDLSEFDGIVMTPRFQRMLDETASLVASPHRIAIRFFGPPGTGKTTIPALISAKMGVPNYRFVFSPRTDPSDVEGMWDFDMVPVLDANGQPVFEDDGVTPRLEYKRVYREGVATVAMEHGGHLTWDEPDLGRPGLLAFLNDVSDPGEYAWVKKADGKLVPIKVHPGFRCFVTENGVREIAREEHGEDFLRRFVPYYVDRWSDAETTKVLAERYEVRGGKRMWSHKVSEVLATLHGRLTFLASSFEDPVTHVPMTPLGGAIQQSVEFTPRSVLRLAERLIASGPMTPETLSRAIRSEYILPLADPDDRKMVWEQIQPILKPLCQEKGWPLDAIGPQAIPVPTLEDIEDKYLGGRKIPPDGFAWTPQALLVVDETLWNRSLGIDVMWLGDAGIGKTRTPEQISKILNVSHFKGKMSGETEEGDLIGIPGPKGFQPGLVTLAVEQGGLGHFDEFLLLQPGRFESVFGPLMDGAQALLIKNPRRTIKRVPGKTFFIFTSNPPWGNFAGKDRYEQSGAAMSRMAVMCLTGDFGITPEDRLAIRMHEPPPPAVRVPLPPIKKKVLSPEAENSPAAGPIGPVLKMAEVGEKEPMEWPVVEVHPDFRKDYGLPSQLSFDLKRMQILEPDGQGGFRDASEAVRKRLDDLSAYLKKRTKMEMSPIVKRVFDMTFRFFGDQYADLGNKRVFFNVIDLLRFSMVGALGVGKHEWAHQILDALHPKYFSNEPARLLFNVVADPRMQEFVASLADGIFEPQAQEVNETQWPLAWDEEQQKRWVARTLPHEQFAHAVIHFWRSGEIMPWIENEKVREALEEAKPYLTAAFHALPEGLSNKAIEKAREAFYEQLDHVWPLYESLFSEGLKEIVNRLENGEKPEDIVREALDELMKGMELPPLEPGAEGDLEKMAQAILDARAEAMADRFEPNDPQKFEEKKERIRQLKSGTGTAKSSASLPPVPAPPAGLNSDEKKEIEAGLRRVDRQQVEGNFYRELISQVPGASRLLSRLKKVLPPARPTHMEGHFRSGRRLDAKKAHQNDMSPFPDPREMLKNAIPSDVQGTIVTVTDVSYSMVMSGADVNALKASAVSIYLSEGLNLRYGEVLFGSKVEEAKPLGKRLGSYAAKNEMLNGKKQAFRDEGINRGTDIRRGLAKAIEWIKEKPSRAKTIILITDGSENISDYGKTLPELEAECEKEGIDLLVLAMGDAQRVIHFYFKPEHYRFVKPDGSDIPEIIISKFEETHRKRLPGR